MPSVLFLVLSASLPGQVDSVAYRHVVDFQQVLRGLTATTDSNKDFEITELSISADKWVALLSFRKFDSNSIVATGSLTGGGTTTRQLDYRPARAVLDGQNRIYLQGDQRAQKRAKSIFELKEDGALIEIAQIPDTSLIPLRSDGEVLWSGPEGIWRERSNHASRIKRPAAANEPVPAVENERRFVLGLSGNRHVVLRDRVEMATVYDGSGSVISTAVLRFDHAYASIGRRSAPVDIHLVGSGRSRVIWATTSAAGELYICLADTPVKGPAYVAVFDPQSGHFVRMLSAARPKGIALRISQDNPDGTMIPLLGSVYEHMVIADRDAGIAAIY